MFSITDKEYDKIIDVISSICCDCSPAYCAESNCDIHKICEILNLHLEKDWLKEDDVELPF